VAEPRGLRERAADALVKLETRHADLWLATASRAGEAHLVPLSFAWNGTAVILATETTSRTVRNITDNPAVRMALGGPRDVVMIDARVEERVPLPSASDELADLYARQADWDPRSATGDLVYLVVRPIRIQVWREANEIVGRTVMRAGAWLA
jgi:general stress protein 26